MTITLKVLTLSCRGDPSVIYTFTLIHEALICWNHTHAGKGLSRFTSQVLNTQKEDGA